MENKTATYGLPTQENQATDSKEVTMKEVQTVHDTILKMIETVIDVENKKSPGQGGVFEKQARAVVNAFTKVNSEAGIPSQTILLSSLIIAHNAVCESIVTHDVTNLVNDLIGGGDPLTHLLGLLGNLIVIKRSSSDHKNPDAH